MTPTQRAITSPVDLWIKFTNVGHLSGQMETLSVGESMRFHSGDRPLTCENRISDPAHAFYMDQPTDIAPESQLEATIAMRLKRECFDSDGHLHPDVLFTYTGYGNKSYTQSVSIVVDTHKTAD